MARPRERSEAALALCAVFPLWGLLLGGTNAQADQGIAFTYVPPWGNYENLRGSVTNVVPAAHKVAVYIYVDGWWNKPDWASPLTPIQPDSSWTCDITTGGADHEATRISAFLVTNAYAPPTLAGHATLPSELHDNALGFAYAERQAPVRAITFSGLTWEVKTSSVPLGPGPNYYSDREEDVWVDEDGKLHLTITQRESAWYCTEIAATNSFGHGTYVFYVESSVTNLDPNAVLGLFTWDALAPEYAYREIDIELSQWGDPGNANAQFVVQPWHHSGNRFRFDITEEQATTHTMVWSSNSIAFQSSYGLTRLPPPADVVTNWTYTGSSIPPPGGENPRINLWLIDGAPPADGHGTEIVISGFDFVPLLTEIGPFTITPGNELTWNAVSGAIYQVEWCEDLRTADWQPLGLPILATGAACTARDDEQGATGRFYRIGGSDF